MQFYDQKWIARHARVNVNYPLVVNIEITSRCNAHCVYCGRDQLMADGTRTSHDMDFGLLSKIIDQLAALPIAPQRIAPVGLGDPLLYRHLPQAIVLIKEKLPNTIVQINTNAIYFPGSLMQSLIDSGIDELLFSVNFHSRALYEKYNGLDKHGQVVDHVIEFLKIRGMRKPRVTIQILDLKDNAKDFSDFIGFWRQHLGLFDKALIRPFNDFGGTVNPEELGAISENKRRYPCAQIFDHLMINADGFCFPCCMGITAHNKDPLCIGDLGNSTILELFSPSGQVQKIRQMHREGKYDELPVCDRCGTWKAGPSMFLKWGGRWI